MYIHGISHGSIPPPDHPDNGELDTVLKTNRKVHEHDGGWDVWDDEMSLKQRTATSARARFNRGIAGMLHEAISKLRTSFRKTCRTVQKSGIDGTPN